MKLFHRGSIRSFYDYLALESGRISPAHCPVTMSNRLHVRVTIATYSISLFDDFALNTRLSRLRRSLERILYPADAAIILLQIRPLDNLIQDIVVHYLYGNYTEGKRSAREENHHKKSDFESQA